MRSHIMRLWYQTGGGAAVEFGFVFPFFSILILGVVEYGMVPLQVMNLSNAAQVGAQYAMLKGYNPTSIQAAVTAASGIPAGSISVTESCGCPTGTAITSTSCTPPLPTCSNGQVAGAYVTVSVQQALALAAPGIPNTLTAATVVRVQ